MYARPDLWPGLRPRASGWFGQREQFRFDPRAVDLHSDARRLEAGTPALMPVYAQLGGLDVIEELGTREIRRRTMALAEDLIEEARAAGLRPKVAPSADERTAIVMLRNDDPPAAVRRLADAGIVTDSRPGHVRISPYFYNVPDDHRAAIERLTS
jgi:kynureninase